MHLLTGVVIAALAGRAKQNKVLQGLPNFQTGPIQIAHALPSRIRFFIPLIRDNTEAVRAGIEQISALKGIETVAHSMVSGSLTVRFDPDIVPPPLLFSAIAHLLGLEHELNKPVSSGVLKEIRELQGSLNRMVHNETRGILDLQTIAVGGLLIIGVRKLVLEKWVAVPGGLTLIWWALNLINRGEGRNS